MDAQRLAGWYDAALEASMIPLLLSLVGPAEAAEQLVDIPYDPPAELPLLRSAAVVDVKGKVDGDDCAGAVEDALAAAGEGGTVVRVIVSTDDLTAAGKLQCRQRVAGDFIASSVVHLSAVVVESRPGPAFPPISADRSVQLAALLAALGGDGEPPAIVDIDGSPWLDLGLVEHPEQLHSGQLDANARAVKMYEEYVPPWVARWAPVLGSVPEVKGAVLVVEMESEDPGRKKSRAREQVRFAVPTAQAASFLSGAIGDDALLAVSSVALAPNARKPVFERLELDVIEGGLAVEGEHGEVQRSDLDVEDEDLENLEDLEEPVESGETWQRQGE